MAVVRLCDWRSAITTVFLMMAAASVASAQSAPDLSGTWIRTRATSSAFEVANLTEAGKRKYEAYDYRTDDPAFRCIASSWTRVWGNTNVPIQITQAADHVRIRYEWMDIDRRLPLVDPVSPNPTRAGIKGMASLGSSAAWYDGDTLVIDTIEFGPGYTDTVNATPGGTRRAGLPQSQRMHTVERIRRSGNTLILELTLVDPAYYLKPFVVHGEYERTDLELMEYGCTPDDASIVAPR